MFLELLVQRLALFTTVRYRPGIIGVTGSVGKTSTKFAIATVLSLRRNVRASYGNFNDELGLPLSVLGDWHAKDLKLWSRAFAPGENTVQKAIVMAKIILISFFCLIIKGPYPELLVLEYGVDKPGDMRKLVSLVRPTVGVVTAIGEIPVHVEFFAGPDQLAREKARLVEALPASGFAVLNYDDAAVFHMKERTRARIITFGFGEGADVRIIGLENRMDGGRPLGVTFKLEYGGSVVPVRMDGTFGKAQAYAGAAAAAVGIIYGLHLVEIAEGLARYHPFKGRMSLLAGIKETWVIDDSYNAAPLSMLSALEVLKDLTAKRRVAILGDMLEIGHYTVEAHEGIGRVAAKAVNILVTVGPRAKFIGESARKFGLQRKNIFEFETVEEAIEPVKELLRKGDLVLVKASRAIGLEKMVEEIRVPEELGK